MMKKILIALIFLCIIFLAGLIYFKVFPAKFSFNPFSPTKISVDKKPLKKLVFDFLPQVVNVQYIPLEIGIDLTQTSDKGDFAIRWNTEEGEITGAITLSSDQKSLSSIFLSPWQEQSASASAVFSVQPKADQKCKKRSSTSFCESFWEEDGIKKGIGLQSPVFSQTGKAGYMAIFCQFDKNSVFHNWKSCFSEFSQKGI